MLKLAVLTFFHFVFTRASLQPINGYTVWESSKHICLSTFCKKFHLSLRNHFLISFEGNFLNLITFDFASSDEWSGELYVDVVNPQKFLFFQQSSQLKSQPDVVSSGSNKKVTSGCNKKQKPGCKNNRCNN